MKLHLNHGIDHGRTLSIVLPAIERKENSKFDKLVQYGKRLEFIRKRGRDC